MNSRKIIRKIRLVSGIIVLFLFLFSSYSYAESSGRITVGSFNIQIFSVQKVKREEVLHVLAETAARFDILAIQEAAKEYGDPDVICAGDYNGDLPYYEEGSGENLAGFDGCITGIPNSADTNVVSSLKTYDRMEMTDSLDTDFTGSWGVFIISDYYDILHCEGTGKTQGMEAALSDHYPVWCSFYEDRDTD